MKQTRNGKGSIKSSISIVGRYKLLELTSKIKKLHKKDRKELRKKMGLLTSRPATEKERLRNGK